MIIERSSYLPAHNRFADRQLSDNSSILRPIADRPPDLYEIIRTWAFEGINDFLDLWKKIIDAPARFTIPYIRLLFM